MFSRVLLGKKLFPIFAILSISNIVIGCRLGIKDSHRISYRFLEHKLLPKSQTTDSETKNFSQTEPPKTTTLSSNNIGIGSFELPSKIAREKNRAALLLHKNGDFKGSLAGFNGSIAASPNYSKARFNRACALSRLGRIEEAAEDFRLLLREDLLNYSSRLEEDEDLENLRTSSHYSKLNKYIEEIQVIYREVVKNEVAAVTYETGPTYTDYSGPLPGYKKFRIGVYNWQSKHFIPLTPTTNRALGGVLDREKNLVLLLSGKMITATCWVSNPIPLQAIIYDLAQPGRKLYHALGLERSLKTEAPGMYLQAERDSVHITYLQVENYPFARLSYVHRAEKLMETKEHINISEGVLALRGTGLIKSIPTHHIPVGISLKGQKLFVKHLKKVIKVAKGHRQPSIIQSPNSRYLVLITVSTGCSKKTYDPISRHLVEFVDLKTGKVSELSRGKGATVDGRFSRDGTFFLQIEDNIKRYPQGTTTPIEDIPFGVRLVSPLMTPESPADCEGC